jgi:uncharacterized protein (DUF779 family)
MPGDLAAQRIAATEAARQAIAGLRAARGPLMFFLSGGCCDGTTPMCFDLGELRTGDADLLLGEVDGCPFYVDSQHYAAWNEPLLLLDVGDGEAGGFSLSAGPDRHFVIHYRPPG